MKEKFFCNSWYVEYTPEDGARLNRLCYDAYDLLSVEPQPFYPPVKNYGEYEKRPVYGYDDCFPSVDSCQFPDKDWTVPDHGEICWLEWKSSVEKNKLVFEVESKVLPVLFKREMNFSDAGLTWKFKVENKGDKTIPFQHVMHPLMKLDDIKDIELPAFSSVYNETKHSEMKLQNPVEVGDYLFEQRRGLTNMLFLQGINEGKMKWEYKNGITIEAIFSDKLFPSIGIWWNNVGYPDEDGLRRNECAFEPIPGFSSYLNDNYKNGKCMSVLPGRNFEWQINWNIIK
jgi:hypothetical protein